MPSRRRSALATRPCAPTSRRAWTSLTRSESARRPSQRPRPASRRQSGGCRPSSNSPDGRCPRSELISPRSRVSSPTRSPGSSSLPRREKPSPTRCSASSKRSRISSASRRRSKARSWTLPAMRTQPSPWLSPRSLDCTPRRSSLRIGSRWRSRAARLPMKSWRSPNNCLTLSRMAWTRRFSL